jgi:hypothetical protein
MSEMLPNRQRPRVLIDAFKAGRTTPADIPELIHFAWTYDDSPTSDIGESAWLELFEHAGFFTYPPVQISRPTSSATLYRGTTTDRIRRMSWASERDVAANADRRHTSYGITWMYRATIRPETVLAYLHRPDEGWTVVVNPEGLSQIERLEALPSL